MKSDLIGVVEAAYKIEQGAEDWLTGVVRAATPILDAGLGVVSFTYDASIPAAFRIDTFVSRGVSEQAASILPRA